MDKIKTSIQGCGPNRFRLGLTVSDSKKHFGQRGFHVVIHLTPTKIIKCVTTCGIPDFSISTDKIYRKKGYDLYDAKLSNWIIQKNFVSKTKGQPIKLNFSFKKSNGLIHMYFIGRAN